MFLKVHERSMSDNEKNNSEEKGKEKSASASQKENSAVQGIVPETKAPAKKAEVVVSAEEEPLPPPFDPEGEAVVQTLRKKFGENITEVTCLPLLADNITVVVAAEAIHEICSFLRYNPKQLYELCSDCCGNHFDDGHFELLYHLYSFINNQRIRLKVKLEGETPSVDTISDIWQGMNFFEREIYDMYGIRFNNHPDMRRILMPDYWKGHPLRKDYNIHYVPERFRERWWKEGEDGKPVLTYDFLQDKRG